MFKRSERQSSALPLSHIVHLIGVLLVSILVAQHAAQGAQVFDVGPVKQFSAGPYSFSANPISINEVELGYASADYKPQKFSKNYWVFLSCNITFADPDFDGDCMQWKIFDARVRRATDLQLPGFERFWSSPTFSWPYVAYVQVGKLAQSDQQTVFCVIFDYRKKSMVYREKVVVSQDSFATDFPGLFTPPEVAKNNGSTHFAFGFDDGSNRRTICSLHAP